MLDSKKDMAKVLPLLFLTGNQDKINDPPLSLECTSNNNQNQVARSTVYEGLNRPAEDLNQNIELVKDHVDSTMAGVGNPIDAQRRLAHHLIIARLFPWNFTLGRGEYPPSIHKEDLEDIREMQELAFARNTSNSKARAGSF